MNKSKILLAALACTLITNTASAIVITNAFMTNEEPVYCDASELRVVNTFRPNDKLACFFVSFEFAQVGDTYKTKWYYRGALYIDEEPTLVTSLSLRCMARSLKIKYNETMDMPGQYTVEFYYNDERLLKWSFEIRQYCAAVTALGDDVESIEALRAFRDQTLSGSRFGQKAVDLFYDYSPALSKAMEDSPALKASVRAMLKACAAAAKIYY